MKNCSVEIFEELSVRAIIYALTFNIPNEWYGSCSLLCHQRPLNVLRGNAATMFPILGAPDKPCGVGRADANPKLLLNDT